MNWLFESDTFGEDIKGIVEEVKRQGHNAIMVDRVPALTGDSYVDLFPPDACVLFYGSLGYSEQLKKETEWVPGSVHSTANFLWLNYYSYFSNFLLGRDFSIYNYCDMLKAKEEMYDTYGIEDTIFMRPNSGNKPFAGQTMEKKYYDSDVPRMGYGEIDPKELVIVSRPVDIATEWRFIVADHEVITGSQYLPFKMRLHDTLDDRRAELFAQEVVASTDWQPDRLWTLDVCKTTADNWYVIEINSFSCSGFYKCNRQKIVTAASRIATEEWEKKRVIK